MATAASVTVDLTTCPICLEMFDNPKSLPCLHTFCLKCLQGYFKEKCLGDEVPCPMCRKEFTISDNGLESLQHHFFVQQLVDVRKVESSAKIDEALCEVCAEHSDGGSNQIPTATMYCVDCNQKLCERCSRPHRSMKGGAHQVKPLGVEVEQELIQLRGSSCDKHKDKQVELYCLECKENICVLCFAVKHRNHNSGEIPEVSENFRRTITEDGKQIQTAINVVREQSGQIKQVASEFRGKVEEIKKKVLAVGEEVKRSVDSQVNDVLIELDSLTSESAKQANSVQEAYQLALVSLESFHAYSRELLDKGRPSDITRAACELHDRATELLNNDVTAVKYRPPHVTFTPADVAQVKRLNFIGKVTVTTGNQPEPALPSVLRVETEQEREVTQQLKQANDTVARLQDDLSDFRQRSAPLWEKEINDRDMGRVIQTLPEGEPVWGVTSLDNHLYVLRGNKSSEQIEVYDIDSYRLLRSLTVPGLGYRRDIVACRHNRCAYISDKSHNSVHRLALPDATVTHWPVHDTPACLSLTYTHGVLVSCWEVRKIKEFSTDGQLLHELTLPQDVVSMWHAVQLSSGQFIVCHGFVEDPLHRVCLIGSDGSVVNSFGGPRGSGSQQMNLPAHMAVDRNEFVFVVDINNDRVSLLSPQLTFVRDVVPREQLKWLPLRVHLDCDRGRLYVADNEYKDGKFTAGRVVVVSV